ncbi:MAG: class I SAM-dependent methyltransferase [Chloroflexi bacterium]|nr:class I SAM-dependent methyltransferase [Chloroflexota bacterium]
MTTQPGPVGQHRRNHDDADQWRAPAFVSEWVEKDDGTPQARIQTMREALAATPYAKDEPLAALDVGAGYGMFASEVLRAFPKAVVTLQDVSEPMFELARERFADQVAQMRFVRSDLSKPGWTSEIGGPFDLAVSSIAIHNLYDESLIARVYAEVYGLLKPGGTFINIDHIQRVGGAEGQTRFLRDAGFADVECITISERLARLSARKAS